MYFHKLEFVWRNVPFVTDTSGFFFFKGKIQTLNLIYIVQHRVKNNINIITLRFALHIVNSRFLG